MNTGLERLACPADYSLIRLNDVDAAVKALVRATRASHEPVDLSATPLGLRAWAHHFGDRTTGLLGLQHDACQRALLPISSRLRGLGPMVLRTWSSPGNFHWHFGYPMAVEDVGGTLAVMLELLRNRNDWDVLELGPMLETSTHVQTLRSWGERLGMAPQDMGRKTAPVVVARQPWDAYYAGLSKSLRDKVGNGERRLLRDGPLTLVCYTGGPDLAQRLRAFFELEASGWKGREGTAILSDAKAQAFYVDLAQEAAAQGHLRLYELRVGDRLIACDYCMAFGDTVQVFKIAYDESLARSSPGQVMRKRVLQNLFEHGGAAVYDLRTGGGDHAGYKLRWANGSRHYVSLRLFNPSTARGRLAQALARARQAFRRLSSRTATP